MMPVAILCGGAGTRLREETEARPKPMVEIGGVPVLVHIMRIFARQGFTRFVLLLGYRGRMVKEYFMAMPWLSRDFTLALGTGSIELHGLGAREEWTITFVDTGLDTPTGGRLSRAKPYLGEGSFMATYGDGLADVDVRALLAHHQSKARTATVTGVRPASPFGIIDAAAGVVASFKEKPVLEGLVNGGFFVFEQDLFRHLNDATSLEEEPLRALAGAGQLAVYEHRGFWACMDTFKDAERLRAMWDAGTRPWEGVSP